MKISLAQIILGLGILVAMALSIALDSNGFYIRESLGEPGHWKMIFNPDTREVVATILSYIVLLLGLAVMGIAITLLNMKIRSQYITPDYGMKIRVKKLAIIQIGLGLLVTVSAFFVTIWGFPTSYVYAISDNIHQVVSFMPGPRFFGAQNLSLLAFLLSVIVLRFSIAQLRSARLSTIHVTSDQ